MRESVLALLFDRQHLNRDMPGCRIQLQIVEDRPAEHIRQEDVQRDGRWSILSGQAQRRLAAMRDDSLESFVARHSEQDTRVMRIVVDDEQDTVAFDNVIAIVGNQLFRLGDHRQRRLRRHRVVRVGRRSRDGARRAGVDAAAGRA